MPWHPVLSNVVLHPILNPMEFPILIVVANNPITTTGFTVRDLTSRVTLSSAKLTEGLIHSTDRTHLRLPSYILGSLNIVVILPSIHLVLHFPRKSVFLYKWKSLLEATSHFGTLPYTSTH